MDALPSISTTNMELEFSSQQLNGNGVNASTQKEKSNNSPGIGVAGNKIHDSSKAKTCHQCRQKFGVFAAMCKNPRNGKPCVLKFCCKCLLNRYGETEEEVDRLSDWKCPKCRGICNCSCCMKRQGQQPTGKLARTAKESGFKSVSEMINVTGKLELTKVNNDGVLPTKEATTKKELVVIPSSEAGMENSLDENGGLEIDALIVLKTSSEKPKRKKREELKKISNGNRVDVAVQNNRLKRPNKNHTVTTNISPTVSEKETKVNKNHDLVHGLKGGPKDWARNDYFFDPMTLASEMHQKNKNETIIKGDCGNPGDKSQTNGANSRRVKKCLVDSKGEKVDKEIPLPQGIELRKILDMDFPPEDVGNALQFLEFCRVFGEGLDVNKGEAESILRELEKILEQKLQDEMAKAIMPNEASLSILEHDDVISKIKGEVAQAHTEMLEAKGKIPKRKQTSDAMRIKPEFLDTSGHAFWKLKTYDDEPVVLLQDIKVQDAAASATEERWFVYGPEKKGDIDKYISSRKNDLD
ncbi:Zinc-finger domain of monoamine-oxidase A repressor R1 [Sesbania bispinosa]|nr:Zinc-finger domain of monoamine-oxidase A repressor R1 [Sesbania bispinosa]